MSTISNILPFETITLKSLPEVGGKNASLGEMIQFLTKLGIKVPQGFAISVSTYRSFLSQNGLDERIQALLKDLNVDDVLALAEAGTLIRSWIMEQAFLPDMEKAILAAYTDLAATLGEDASFAVRSSATAEDLPDASFAGQQETYLNVKGFKNILKAIKQVYASLFTDRAIAYRQHQGYAHHAVGLSVGIQRMVRSDLACSGVMFTIDTETGFERALFITGAYGLGETVVQGAVNPDEFYVLKENIKKQKPAILRRYCGSKAIKMVYGESGVETLDVPLEAQRQFILKDSEIERLAQYALLIEEHYQRPMDIEWAKDGIDNELYIVQARPETVKSQQNPFSLEQYRLLDKGTVLAKGRSVGQKIGRGPAKIIRNISELSRVQSGDVLISQMTDPDWEPVMKKVSAIVTDKGGRTCHAAIIARELGIPAVVGCGDATSKIKEGDMVTVSCAGGEEGLILAGKLHFEIERLDVETLPQLPLKVMLNVANPEKAFLFSQLPHSGIGLARLEFIISNTIGIHPRALLEWEKVSESVKETILEKTAAYASPKEFYIAKLTESIATLTAAFAPHPVIVRFSDFKSNEYANLIGGQIFEPDEENPMLGFRGAARYIDPAFQAAFALECEAIKRVRNEMGLLNLEIMIPFVRTPAEAKKIVAVLAENGLVRGEKGLRIIMMCEIPSNAILAKEFLQYFDGFSIGSNDLTQLTLGLDRDSALVASYFDERDPAVKYLLELAIAECLKENKYIGICGQGPSDHKDFASWLMEKGIQSVSLNPDTLVETCLYLAKKA